MKISSEGGAKINKERIKEFFTYLFGFICIVTIGSGSTWFFETPNQTKEKKEESIIVE